jgi:hypothetical protein
MQTSMSAQLDPMQFMIAYGRKQIVWNKNETE